MKLHWNLPNIFTILKVGLIFFNMWRIGGICIILHNMPIESSQYFKLATSFYFLSLQQIFFYIIHICASCNFLLQKFLQKIKNLVQRKLNCLVDSGITMHFYIQRVLGYWRWKCLEKNVNVAIYRTHPTIKKVWYSVDISYIKMFP